MYFTKMLYQTFSLRRMRRRNNLILITIDCLRADYVYNRKDLAPNINDLMYHGITFVNATSVSYSTPPSFMAMFSKTFPSEFEGILSLKLRGSLVRRIRDAGYVTTAIHNNPFISRLYGFDEGFNYFYDDLITSKIIGKESYLLKIRSPLKGKIKSEFLRKILQKIYRKITIKRYRKYNLWADEINNIFIDWLRKEYKDKHRNKPFFAWLHYMDLHAPYLPPLNYLPSGMSPKEVIRINQMKDQDLFHIRDKVIELYCASLKYLDHALKRFLERLEELGKLHNTYVIITADHGHGFWEHGVLGHLSSCLYEELIHVPLTIIGSDLKLQRVETPVSLYSLFDIIYELLGIRSRSLILDGKFDEVKYANISNVISEGGSVKIPRQRVNRLDFELSEIAVKIKHGHYVYKYIFRYNGQHELYNLTKDPLEKRNIANEDSEIVKKLYDVVLKHQEKVRIRDEIRNKVVKLRKFRNISLVK